MAYDKRWKDTQARKAVFRAVEQEIGLAQEGDQEKDTKKRTAVAIVIPTPNRELSQVA
jgi:hypothetical protein